MTSLNVRGKWFLLIIKTASRIVKFWHGGHRRSLKISTMAAHSSNMPMTTTGHTQSGAGCGDGADAMEGGAASVRKVKVADQSLGTGSTAMTLQK